MKIVIPANKTAVNLPKNYVLLSDSSGSMWGAVDELKKTIIAVSKLMTPQDTITIGDFSSYGDFDYFVRGLSLKDSALEKLINTKIRARGLTCYTQALGELKKIVNDVKTISGNNNFCFYFLSDGYPNDNSPEKEILRLCGDLKGLFVEATIVGYGNYYNRNTLLQMAEKIGGKFNHVNDYKEMERNYEEFFKGKKSRKNVEIDQKYDFVWQVSTDIVPLQQNANNSVDVLESDGKNDVYAINLSELENLKQKDLTEPSFVYSLAYVLSQKNKANLGVSVLRKAGDETAATSLRKAFTVSQKGKAENDLKELAINSAKVNTAKNPIVTIALKDFVGEIASNLGNVAIDTKASSYNKISRAGEDVSKVEFKLIDPVAKIIEVVGNENRPNISFLTVRKGQITKVTDKELDKKIKNYNKANKNSKIEFPFLADTYRNYTLVANGDFNYDELVIERGNKTEKWVPEKQIDIFDEDVKSVSLKDFSNLYKALIAEKAHASVLRFYIKNNTDQKQADDLRVSKYGAEGKEILEELGLDYQLRYAPKTEGKPKDENADYVPFTEITAYLEGSSTINAKTSYEKYVKKGKQNAGDKICWPYFDKYDALLQTLGKETFVETLQSTLKGVEKTKDLLQSKIASQKFYLITTNSWFDGVDKADEINHDGLVIKVKETKEYL